MSQKRSLAQLELQLHDLTADVKTAVAESEERIVNRITVKCEAIQNTIMQYVTDTVTSYMDNMVAKLREQPIVTSGTVPNTPIVVEHHSTTVTGDVTGHQQRTEQQQPIINDNTPIQQPKATADDNTTAKQLGNTEPPGRLRTAMVAKHDVYIGGLSPHTTEDDVRAHLMDIRVNSIISIHKLKIEKNTTSAFRVAIADDTIKHNVFNPLNFENGITIKPFRFYEEDPRQPKATNKPPESRNTFKQKKSPIITVDAKRREKPHKLQHDAIPRHTQQDRIPREQQHTTQQNYVAPPSAHQIENMRYDGPHIRHQTQPPPTYTHQQPMQQPMIPPYHPGNWWHPGSSTIPQHTSYTNSFLPPHQPIPVIYRQY